MRRRWFFPTLCLTAVAVSFFPAFASGQLVLGQYEDEAPFRTWNTHPYTAAAALGRGETAFTLASDASAALANPALLPGLPRFTLTVNGYFQSASFFKYGPLNTGVLGTDENITQGLLGLDFAGLSVRLGGWTFALNVSLTELYNRPEAKYEENYRGTLVYMLKFTQDGVLRNVNFSAARRFGSRLSVGLGLNYSTGSLQREFLEQSAYSGYTITDKKTQNFNGFCVNGGLLLEITDKFRLAAAFRTPHLKNAENSSTLRYLAPAGNTDILIAASSKDGAKQPLVLGLGASYALLPELTLATDISYYAWSKYSLDYFGEKQARNFKDIFKIGSAAEYRAALSLFGGRAWIPFRAGLIYDPQPMKEPNSSYLGFTLGTGSHWKGLSLDLGAMFGRESGSGNDLTVKRIALSLGLNL